MNPALARWSWRLFRREWRQQALVLILLTAAVAATTAGVAAVTNTVRTPRTVYTLSGSDPQLATDLAAFRSVFPGADVAYHRKAAVPGSVSSVDVRSDGNGRAVRPLAGKAPTVPGEVALTKGVAALLGLRVGDTWDGAGPPLRVTGVVENPENLADQFALVAPGQVDAPQSVTVTTSGGDPGNFRLHTGTPLQVDATPASAKASAAAGVLVFFTIGLLFVGLVAAAAFTVTAQRRMRSLGVLGSIGASDAHLRSVMVVNGVAVGVVSSVTGAATGLAGWLLFAPRLEHLAQHRINRFDVPWWAVGLAMGLALVAAVLAAWWPARIVARVPIVSALSGRPPRPQPAHRFAAAGVVCLCAGTALLALAHQRRPMLVIAGAAATVFGVLFLAPLAIRLLAASARRAPIAVRLAVRDLARYQARSGAALGAATLAIGIAATVSITAAANAATVGAANLPANQMVVRLADAGDSFIPDLAPAQITAAQHRAAAIAAELHTSDVTELDAAISPTAPEHAGPGNGVQGHDGVSMVKVTPMPHGFGEQLIAPLYVATPALLARYGVTPRPDADVVSSRTDLGGLQLGLGLRDSVHPTVQIVGLPTFTSAPNALITTRAVTNLGLSATPAAWLIQTPHPLTASQLGSARATAAVSGLTIETRDAGTSSAQLGNDATAIGLLLALGVFTVTVGLIRTETRNDLRTLTATGAGAGTRRVLTGATAGALGLLGGVLGTAGAYAGLIAWHWRDVSSLAHVPAVDLAAILVGLPALALAGGWLLAGREPPAIARQPLS